MQHDLKISHDNFLDTFRTMLPLDKTETTAKLIKPRSRPVWENTSYSSCFDINLINTIDLLKRKLHCLHTRGIMIKESLAANIKKHRSDKGLSQDALAGKAEIATRYLQEIEAAEKQPSVTTIFKLAKALEVEYTSLLAPAWSQWLEHGNGEE